MRGINDTEGMSRKPYPTDVTDDEWNFVAPYLTLMREDAPQREYSLREVFNALRYVARSGEAWRMMPNDLPPWPVVYQQMQRWYKAKVFEAMVHDLREILRLLDGRNPAPTAAVIDSLGEQLQQLDLSAAAFAGTNLTISVKQTGTGDGLTNVGYIKAIGNLLGTVTVAGDLGRIDAGGGGKAGITSLSFFSLGRQGTSSQQTGGNLISNITSLGTIAVTTDINQAFVNVTGSIGSIKVDGSLIGGTAANSGSIQSANGSIGTVFVGQNLFPSSDVGAAAATGAASIQAGDGSIGNVTVVGWILGGSARDSAEISANDKLGKVLIGGSLSGGGGDFSAEVEATTIASVTVNGSITGGGGNGSGSLLPGSMGTLFVGGNTATNAGTAICWPPLREVACM